MAGAPWIFTLSPESINEITVSDGITTDILQRQEVTIGQTEFLTNKFVETSTVTISATGYQNLTATVGDSGLVMIASVIVVKPEYLYGYTNNNIITTTYYCWRNETYSNSIYTLTAQPIESEDDLYIKNSTTGDFEPASANVIESVAEDYSYINDSQLGARSKHNRYSEGDEIVSTSNSPLILYTDSTTLVVGMPLYDNTGTITNYTISEISPDGSFNITENQQE